MYNLLYYLFMYRIAYFLFEYKCNFNILIFLNLLFFTFYYATSKEKKTSNYIIDTNIARVKPSESKFSIRRVILMI